jgi:hypothetical protein
MPDVHARIGDRERLVGQLVEPAEARERRPRKLGEGRELVLAQAEVVGLGDPHELRPRWWLDGHDLLPRFAVVPNASTRRTVRQPV